MDIDGKKRIYDRSSVCKHWSSEQQSIAAADVKQNFADLAKLIISCETSYPWQISSKRISQLSRLLFSQESPSCWNIHRHFGNKYSISATGWEWMSLMITKWVGGERMRLFSAVSGYGCLSPVWPAVSLIFLLNNHNTITNDNLYMTHFTTTITVSTESRCWHWSPLNIMEGAKLNKVCHVSEPLIHPVTDYDSNFKLRCRPWLLLLPLLYLEWTHSQ